MDIEKIIISRRSIRKYKAKKVNKDDILSMLNIAIWAPSACNRQAHKIIYIDSDQTKQKLVDLGAAPFIKNAPVILLFLYDNTGDNITYRDDIQSSSALIQNFLIVASANGFGTCWISHLPPPKELRKLFNIPKNINPIAAVSVGYSYHDRSAQVPRRHPVNSIIFDGRMSSEIKLQDYNFLLLIKRFCRKIFYFLPPIIRKRLNPFIDKYFVKKFDN